MNLFELGSNMTNSMYRGWYRGENCHRPDSDLVFSRAKAHGVKKFVITSNSLRDSNFTYQMSTNTEDYYCTFGVNPLHTNDVFKQ